MNDYKQGIYPNIKVREVNYGFGWVIEGNDSTDTIANILTKLDIKFLYLKELIKKLEAENKMMREVLNKIKESEKQLCQQK